MTTTFDLTKALLAVIAILAIAFSCSQRSARFTAYQAADSLEALADTRAAQSVAAEARADSAASVADSFAVELQSVKAERDSLDLAWLDSTMVWGQRLSALREHERHAHEAADSAASVLLTLVDSVEAVVFLDYVELRDQELDAEKAAHAITVERADALEVRVTTLTANVGLLEGEVGAMRDAEAELRQALAAARSATDAEAAAAEAAAGEYARLKRQVWIERAIGAVGWALAISN